MGASTTLQSNILRITQGQNNLNDSLHMSYLMVAFDSFRIRIEFIFRVPTSTALYCGSHWSVDVNGISSCALSRARRFAFAESCHDFKLVSLIQPES